VDLGRVIERASEQFGGRILLTDRDRGRVITFAEFEQSTRSLAQAFAARGLRPGHRVAIALPSSVALLTLLYGALRAGLVAVPLDIRRADTIEYIIADSGAQLLCASEAVASSIEPGSQVDVIVCPDAPQADVEHALVQMVAQGERTDPDFPLTARSDDDVAVLLYTSGTTGDPKGVMLSHRNWFYAALGLIIALELSDDDVAVLTMSLAHASGFLFLAQLIRGGRAVLLPRWEPSEFLTAFVREHATTSFLVPTMLYGLLDCADLPRTDLSTLRVLYYSSAPVNPERLRSALGAFGGRLAQSYGLLEAPMPATVLDRADHQRLAASTADERLLSSAGKEFLLAETAIVDTAGNPVPSGSVGEIMVRGPHVMRGYWNQPEATRQVLHHDWLHTGDLGYRDSDGYLYLTDR
jgi:acyl-CoA synthetase (AMP-forming)/AMP-acid ligase II